MSAPPAGTGWRHYGLPTRAGSLSDQALMKMCSPWLHCGRNKNQYGQIIKELDFFCPGHLCDQRIFEKRFIFLHAAESQITESAFSESRVCQKWKNSQELEGKDSEKQNFCLPRQKINYKIRSCYQNCLYLCFKKFAIFLI